jgi:hypothetical protein
VTDTTVSEYIGKLITHPAIFACQDATITSEINSMRLSEPLDTVTDLPETEDTQKEDGMRR